MAEGWLKSIAREIRRRHMVRTCVLYLFASWVLLQVAAFLFPLVGVEPTLAGRYLLYALLGLFPVVIFLAWFYQFSPEGVERSSEFEERRTQTNLSPLNERRRVPGSRTVHASEYDWVLTAESGPLEGLRYAVEGEIVIGRALESDLAVVSSQVSRRHCRVFPVGAALLVEDLGSANGTRVNGELISATRSLNHEDVLQIHEVNFRVTESFHRAVGENAAINQDTVFDSSPPGSEPQ